MEAVDFLTFLRPLARPSQAREIDPRARHPPGGQMMEQDKAKGTQGNIQQVLSGGIPKTPPDATFLDARSMSGSADVRFAPKATGMLRCRE